jgi:hypothetical protein
MKKNNELSVLEYLLITIVVGMVIFIATDRLKPQLNSTLDRVQNSIGYLSINQCSSVISQVAK